MADLATYLRRRSSPPPAWVGPALAGAAAAVLWLGEGARPLRRARESRSRRLARNLGVGVLTAVTTRLCEAPVVPPLLRRVEEEGLGLLPRLPLGAAARRVLGFLLLDYTLYLWHWLSHRSPLLWRAHVVHHLDVDLDSSTALRFHFQELAVSTGHRALQIALLGVDRATLAAWSGCLFASVVFHHSNLRLPLGLERVLSAILVTPRLHGIHHSRVQQESDSNYSSLLTVWDRLHGTLLQDLPQARVRIGIPAWPDPLPLGEALALPYREMPESWAFPDGTRPEPAPRSGEDRLAV